MINLILDNQYFNRTYLKKTRKYHYNSFLDLVYEIFDTHHFDNPEIDLIIYDFLKGVGYHRIADVPIPELKMIANYFIENREAYKVDYDAEKLTYLVLASVQNGDLIALVDEQNVTNLQSSITLSKNSTISFIKREKINNIGFSTL